MVIKLGIDVFVGLEHPGVFLESDSRQFELLHLIFHDLEFLGELEFLLSTVRDLLDVVQLSGNSLLSELLNGDCLLIQLKVFDDLLDFMPIFVVEGLRHNALHKRQVLAEFVNVLFEFLSSVRCVRVVLVQGLSELEESLLPSRDRCLGILKAESSLQKR